MIFQNGEFDQIQVATSVKTENCQDNDESIVVLLTTGIR